MLYRKAIVNPEANLEQRRRHSRTKWEIMVVLCFGMPALWSLWKIYKQVRKEQIKAALSQGIERNDSEMVVWSLEQGVNPNFPMTTTKISTWRLILDSLLGKAHPIQASGDTTLQAVFTISSQADKPPDLTEQAKIVRSLVAHGANVNVKDSYGVPLIVDATLCNDNRPMEANLDVVRCLLDHGADINAQTRNGYSLLLLAIDAKNIALAEILLRRHAQCKLYNEQVCALQEAKATRNLELIRLAAKYQETFHPGR